MALKRQTLYEETNAGVSEVVVDDHGNSFEKNDGEWLGPYDADVVALSEAVESGLLVESVELTDKQMDEIKEKAEA